MIKIGLCGLGNMGRNHLRVCKKIEDENSDFKVTNLYDPNIKGFENKSLFLSNAETLNGVIICAPSDKHVDIALELFKINPSIKLLIEKPIDDDIEKASRLLPYSDKILVGHIERFNPAVQKLKELIDAKIITGISAVRTRRLGNFVARSSQFVNLDLLVHDVDITNFLLSAKPNRNHLVTNQTRNDGKTDHAVLVSTYDNKDRTTLIAEASWIEPEKIRNLEIVCNEGKYHMDYIKQEIDFISYAGEKEHVRVNKREPLYEELIHFKNFVQGDEESGCSVEEALLALKGVS